MIPTRRGQWVRVEGKATGIVVEMDYQAEKAKVHLVLSDGTTMMRNGNTVEMIVPFAKLDKAKLAQIPESRREQKRGR